MAGSCVCSTILMAGSALLCLAATAAHAQAISQPLSGSIGDAIYSESAQTGPSSSLIQGGANLTSSYLRSGTSDPLSFLIENSFMSPYAPESALISSYANAAVPDHIVSDSTVAERVSDYRNNRELMSGAGSRSTLAARAALAGSTGSGRSGAGAGSQSSGAFSGLMMRAPFAAGSSALGAGQAGALGSNSFVDPNAYLAAASLAASADMQAGAATGSSLGSNSSGTSSPSDVQTQAYGATGMGVPPPNSTAYGPAPGEVFPDTSTASYAASGFPDSTMGTAGLSGSASESPFSRPLLVGEGERGNPFPSISEETTSFLHPSLLSSSGAVAPGAANGGASINEVTRKARLHAMIYNPGATPSAFQQRAMIRDYARNKRQPHRQSTLTAPSVTH